MKIYRVYRRLHKNYELKTPFGTIREETMGYFIDEKKARAFLNDADNARYTLKMWEVINDIHEIEIDDI